MGRNKVVTSHRDEDNPLPGDPVPPGVIPHEQLHCAGEENPYLSATDVSVSPSQSG
jgi:hypothetical protein